MASFTKLADHHLPGGATPALPLADAAGQLALASQLLHIDCSALPYRHTLGVCYQVSQLLLLRRAGTRVLLYRVHPVLRHCLHQLRVAHLFAWAV